MSATVDRLNFIDLAHARAVGLALFAHGVATFGGASSLGAASPPYGGKRYSEPAARTAGFSRRQSVDRVTNVPVGISPTGPLSTLAVSRLAVSHASTDGKQWFQAATRS